MMAFKSFRWNLMVLTEIDGESMDANKLCFQVVNIISNVNKFTFATDNAAPCFLRDCSKKFCRRNPPITTVNF